MDIFDDLGSILYIVFTLGAVIFGALRKQRKSRQTEEMPQQRETNTAKDPFEELRRIFDEQNLNKELEQEEIEELEEERIDIEEEYTPMADEQPLQLDSIPKEEGTATTLAYENASTISEEDMNNDSLEKMYEKVSSKKKKFNLRQAIIYDAILNRPYK